MYHPDATNDTREAQVSALRSRWEAERHEAQAKHDTYMDQADEAWRQVLWCDDQLKELDRVTSAWALRTTKEGADGT